MARRGKMKDGATGAKRVILSHVTHGKIPSTFAGKHKTHTAGFQKGSGKRGRKR